MSLSNLTTRALLASTFAVALLATSGCHNRIVRRQDGSVRFLPHSHNSDYSKSQENRPLEVPPDLDTPATDPSMQIPAGRAGGSTGSIAPTGGNPSFVLADSVSGSWDRMGRSLERINGVTITQRTQLLNSYEVQYKGATMLLRATPEGGQSTRVDAVGADGQPMRSPEAVELLGLLRNRIG
jgi:uncharacterized lipoprotein